MFNILRRHPTSLALRPHPSRRQTPSLTSCGVAFAEALELLTKERDQPADELASALVAFQAFALADAGRESEALVIVLQAPAPTLTRYQRSVGAYAGLLLA